MSRHGPKDPAKHFVLDPRLESFAALGRSGMMEEEGGGSLREDRGARLMSGATWAS